MCVSLLLLSNRPQYDVSICGTDCLVLLASVISGNYCSPLFSFILKHIFYFCNLQGKKIKVVVIVVVVAREFSQTLPRFST